MFRNLYTDWSCLCIETVARTLYEVKCRVRMSVCWVRYIVWLESYILFICKTWRVFFCQTDLFWILQILYVLINTIHRSKLFINVTIMSSFFLSPNFSRTTSISECWKIFVIGTIFPSVVLRRYIYIYVQKYVFASERNSFDWFFQ